MHDALRPSLVACLLLLSACGGPWNDPYPASARGGNTYYGAFSERPKHLDPVQSYSENEYVLIGNIYMPPLQYHYLRRPYELIPLAAREMPQPRYFDAAGRELDAAAPAASIAQSVYEIRLRPGMRYQPHPALAVDGAGRPAYLDLGAEQAAAVFELRDLPLTGTREVTAQDYVHQIKRLAHPRLHSPILSLMEEHIVGLPEFAEQVRKASKGAAPDAFVDLDRFELAGATVVDRYTYRIRIRGKYPQFVYWLAMPFFAPMPVEADRFYAQAGLARRNINLDWYPLGSGPYMLTVNNPNRQMVLERNPNFVPEAYPADGEPEDRAAGRLADAGRPMPFLDRVVFTLEKESIPYWNKFLQGYYDASAISSDNFDQTIQMSGTGEPQLSDAMRAQGIRLQTSVNTSDSYIGFNMLDPVVGGESDRARKLRLAISIAIDQEEFISIFANGRGIPAQGPIPPGIFGYRDGAAGINPFVYEWRDGSAQRRSLAEARRLLAEAGYPDGVDTATGKPLLIYFDSTLAGAESKARVDWLTKQFRKLDLQLVMRNTDYNRFQDKVRKGTAQLFYWGWNADYPDPENFLFLFLSGQGKVKYAGENASNYANAEYDRLFERMRAMPGGPERQAVVDRMVDILRHDAPWVFGFHPKDYGLSHQWVGNSKANKLAHTGLKYLHVDAGLRDTLRAQWNRPVLWPLVLLAVLVAGGLAPAVIAFRRRERATALAAAGEGARP